MSLRRLRKQRSLVSGNFGSLPANRKTVSRVPDFEIQKLGTPVICNVNDNIGRPTSYFTSPILLPVSLETEDSKRSRS